MCPGQNESAGKRTSSRLRKGEPWLKTMGGDAKKGQLLRSSIQAAACHAWTEESDLRRRRLDAHGDLPYAEGRDVPSGPRRRSFRPPFERGESQASRGSTRQARLPRRITARRPGSLNARSRCIAVDTVLAVNAAFGFLSIWLSVSACSLRSRTRRTAVHGPAALLDLRCARRPWRIRSGRRNDRFPIEQRNRESRRGSGWHGDSRIERLACLQNTEAKYQELAHGSDDDLFGLEATRFLEARNKSCDGGIETHRRQRWHVE
jgi:hypothetical protein